MAKRALCIGINNYPGTGNDLSGCVNDVTDWTAALEKRGFTVTCLLDSQATKVAMVGSIERLIGDTKSGDIAVLQYSGHGSWVPDSNGDEPDGRDEVLCPCNIGSNSYLTDDELFELFGRCPEDARLAFFSDSCHSGSVSRFAPGVDVGPAVARSRFLPPETFLSDRDMPRAERVSGRPAAKASPNRCLLMSGCQDAQTSADAWFNGRANGAFTYYAHKALQGLADKATYADWHRAIRKFLPSSAYTQKPNLFGSASKRQWPVL